MLRSWTIATLLMGVLLGGCEDESALPEGNPKGEVYDGNYGATYKRFAVTTVDRAAVYWAQEIASGFASPTAAAAPAAFEPAHLSGTCHLKPPSDDAEVVFVEVYSGNRPMPLHLIGNGDLDGLRSYIERNGSRPDIDRLLETSAADQIDVFITETDRPIYLVLSAYDETLWSLQLAEGVQLDGIAIIGYEAQALAHKPDLVLASFAVVDDSPQQHCAITPQRPVNETWRILHREREGRTSFTRTLDEARRDHSAFRSWLASKIGYPDRTLDAYQTSHVLIGPRPDIPIPYRPLTGADIIYAPSATPIWGSASDAERLIYGLAEAGG